MLNNKWINSTDVGDVSGFLFCYGFLRMIFFVTVPRSLLLSFLLVAICLVMEEYPCQVRYLWYHILPPHVVSPSSFSLTTFSTNIFLVGHYGHLENDGPDFDEVNHIKNSGQYSNVHSNCKDMFANLWLNINTCSITF